LAINVTPAIGLVLYDCILSLPISLQPHYDYTALPCFKGRRSRCTQARCYAMHSYACSERHIS